MAIKKLTQRLQNHKSENLSSKSKSHFKLVKQMLKNGLIKIATHLVIPSTLDQDQRIVYLNSTTSNSTYKARIWVRSLFVCFILSPFCPQLCHKNVRLVLFLWHNNNILKIKNNGFGVNHIHSLKLQLENNIKNKS